VDLPLPEIPVITESLTDRETHIDVLQIVRARPESRSSFRHRAASGVIPGSDDTAGDFKQRAVSEFGFFWTSLSVPLATTSPP
jgi:hypothetical protein